MRVGLRLRLTVAFAVGSLVLSAALAVLTYETARTYLLRQRENSAMRQAFVNARLLRTSLRGEAPDVPRLLASLESGNESHVVLRYRGTWFGSSVGVGRENLPPALRDRANAGGAARQRFALTGTPHLAVAVPVPAIDAVYFEVFPLTQLASTLGVLRNSLLAASVFTTVAGAAFGLLASRRVLRPVAAVAAAAAEVAHGNLDARMEEMDDADLDTVATSFNRMTESLRARIERDRRFVAAVSHELRSPLTTLAAVMEVLRARRQELPARGREALDLAGAEVERFDCLVQDLLEISRLDAGVVEVPEEEVTVGPFVLHVMTALQVDSADVDLDADAFEAVVLADKRRLERVMANLVANARAYAGDVRRVSVERHGAHVRIVIEDDGPGVAEEERERIFERFVRGRSAGARGGSSGTGLGLSIVQEHVALHGGRVWVESGPQAGARFVVELPVQGP